MAHALASSLDGYVNKDAKFLDLFLLQETITRRACIISIADACPSLLLAARLPSSAAQCRVRGGKKRARGIRPSSVDSACPRAVAGSAGHTRR